MQKQHKAQPYIYILVTFIFVLIAQWLPQNVLAGQASSLIPIVGHIKYVEQMGEILDAEILIANQRAQRRLAQSQEQQKSNEAAEQIRKSCYIWKNHCQELTDDSLKSYTKIAMRALIRYPEHIGIVKEYFTPESPIRLKIVYASIIYAADHSNMDAYNLLKEWCTKKDIEDLRTYRLLILEEESFCGNSGGNRSSLVAAVSSTSYHAPTYEAIYDRITQNIVRRFR